MHTIFVLSKHGIVGKTCDLTGQTSGKWARRAWYKRHTYATYRTPLTATTTAWARRSRNGYFSQDSRERRVTKHKLQQNTSSNDQGVSRGSSSGSGAATRNRRLIGCSTAETMLAILRAFQQSGHRPVDTIHLGTIFTRLPGLRSSDGAKLQVVVELQEDLGEAISRSFPHPRTGLCDTQGVVNVVSGMLRLGVECNDVRLQQLLNLMDQNLVSCDAASLSGAIDALVATCYSSPGTHQRLIRAISQTYFEADARCLTRFMYGGYELGFSDKALWYNMAHRLLQVANLPREFANTALALARLDVDAAPLANDLAAGVLEFDDEATPQNVANMFLACFEAGWTLSRGTATRLVRLYLKVCESTGCPTRYRCYTAIQVLSGLERHGVQARTAPVSTVLEPLLTIKDCPSKLRHRIPAVIESLRLMGFENEGSLAHLAHATT